MHYWGEFQSFVQLAAALNAAFAGLGTFLGNAIVLERARLHTEISKLQENPLAARANRSLSDVATLISLEGETEHIERIYDRFLDRYVRPFCISGMLFSIFFLAMSSYEYRCPISPTYQIILILTYAPFLAGVIYYIVITVKLRNRVTTKRIEIVNKYSSHQGE